MLNEDYREMLHVLSEDKVNFILVGSYALAAYGYPRATMDIDIWVMPTTENADATLRALSHFGASFHNPTIEGIEIRIPSLDDLILNKKAIGRTKDLARVEALASLKNSERGHGDE